MLMRYRGGILEEARGTVSRVICSLAQEIMAWLEVYIVTIIARFIPEKKNVLADQVSRSDFPTEWSFLPRVIDAICKMFSYPRIDLFAMRADTKLPLYVSPDLMIWRQDTFQHS